MQRKKIQPVLDTFFFYAGDLVWLCAIIAVYLYFAVRHIQYPLLHGDDGGILLAALSIYQEGWRWLANIFKADILLLAEGYHGCADALLLLPFIPFIKDPVLIIRAASIFYASLGILFTFLFTRLLFGRRIALAVSLLLATTPAFVFSSSRCGLFTGTATMIFIAMAALWSLLKWYRSSRLGYFALGCFLLGFGLNTRIWFLWLIVALGVTALLLRLPIIRIMRKAQGRSPLAKHLVIGAILFSLGAFSLLHDNLAGLVTIHTFVSRAKYSAFGVHNANYLLNLKNVLINFGSNLDMRVHWMFVPSDMPFHLRLLTVKHFFFAAFLFLAVWLSAVRGKYVLASCRRMLFVLLLFVIMLLQAPFTPTTLASWHLLFFTSFVCLIIVLGISTIARTFDNGIIKIAAPVLFALLLLNNMAYAMRYQDILGKTGGKGEFSVQAFKNLLAWLKEQNSYKNIIPLSTFHLLSPDVALFAHEKLMPPLVRYREAVGNRWLLDAPENLYFISAEFAAPFSGEIKKYGYDTRVEKVFYDKTNDAAFVVFKVISTFLSTDILDEIYYQGIRSGNAGQVRLEPAVLRDSSVKVLTFSGYAQQDILLLCDKAVFSNFTFDADFKVITSCAGFVFRAQDSQNLYMHQLCVSGGLGQKSRIRWHKRVNGAWTWVDQEIPFEIKPGTWYHARFIVEGSRFALYLTDAGILPDSRTPPVVTWQDVQASFKRGYLGFREWGTEHAQFTNVDVASYKQ